ncbi:DUF2271 domain-containing protein [Dokdonella sp.]|uniref:DUF2271 domain-containing protein n=1 Tax=Dokdonella sp. TaxID=2291710 RepID=UPI0025BD7F92|nr:DUF2271 domain-containing protein [Dokdonella sp.]MBX3689994.1 DUF2271 domain-containing protein [Dokdonella sp.]
MRPHRLFLLAAVVSPAAFAADLQLSLQLPTQTVSEYHRPYVAVWVERADRSVAANLAVWYQNKDGKDAQTGKSEPGSKWLADLRQWWRRSGREQQLPIDGVTGATRPAGQHQLHFSDGKAPLAGLAAGSYKLMIEVAREVGGREVLGVPFSWPPSAPVHLSAQGEHEIGAVKLDLNP